MDVPQRDFPVGAEARDRAQCPLVGTRDRHLPPQNAESLKPVVESVIMEPVPQKPVDKPVEKLDELSDAVQEKIAKLYGKHYIQVDPATKQPYENSKEFFWELMNANPCEKGDGDKKPFCLLFMQKFWRNKTYEATAEPGNDRSGKVRRHIAYNVKNRNGDLIDVGSLPVSYSDFLKRFAEDTN
jgi:hypothetical protein